MITPAVESARARTLDRLASGCYDEFHPLVGRDDEEDWRNERARRALMSFIIHDGDPRRILWLYDHEGTLNVTWRERPTIMDKTRIDFAWKRQGESHVMHYLPQEA